ncbi:MAG: hypothetical protein JWN56_1234 [Sphingobacteriales bacterium]|nr:hypothetical protein [Sphingobacteriales bacterium]
MAIRITCINKDGGNHNNPYEAITHLGWVEESTNKIGKNTRLQIYNWIKDEGGYAYVKDKFGNTAKLITGESPSGTKYVKTEADNTKTDNLLQLMECIG